ncbi:staphylococcal nuclease domain-containing protein 1 [Prorops nasuta]|uniref:staphylococcal nuclease domain-containing protein 1 n=1 Tax=Prorops nasuta TaxID=863751 RepID=UPI0034CDECA5
MSANQVQIKRGYVKQVPSGDQITISEWPNSCYPPVITIVLCDIIAPKLEHRKANDNNIESKDQPYAWEAREFLRKKLIQCNVVYTIEKEINSERAYGRVWLGTDTTGENVTELLVSEGLVSVKKSSSPEMKKLLELEAAAKAAGKGKWSQSPPSEHIRDVKWSVDDPRILLEKYGKKPVKAIIEYVHDGSTIKAFLLDEFYYITLMLSGVRCPGTPKRLQDGQGNADTVADEALYHVESRLLHREVEIVLEHVIKNNFIGSIIHPNGNIAEMLLSKGFAKIQDWSITNDAAVKAKLYLAEKKAKEARLRIWKDYKPSSGPQMEFTGTVIEIVNADALVIRKLDDGEEKKIFLSSIRPPQREKRTTPEENNVSGRQKDFRPLYHIPWMLEAREFLRERFIGKTVKVVADYIQPAKDNFPEKLCCTVTYGKTNIAEALVSKGLARVIKYRQNDDQRSSHYNLLIIAESKAEKSQHGLHAKKDIPVHRLVDLSNNPASSKTHLTSFKRAQGIKAVVEYINSGSRLKLFLPKEDKLITFVLAGIRAPRYQRPLPGGGVSKGDEYGEEALKFTKERCFQRDVEIKIESTETKGAGFIGWLMVNGKNMSVELVEEGLAEVSTYPDSGELTRVLKAAEERAKAKKLNIWKNRTEVHIKDERVEEEKQAPERVLSYQEVAVSEVTDELHFFAQRVEHSSKLETLNLQLRQELAANPPLPGAYKPSRNDLSVAKFTGDDQWYRVKVERISGSNVSVFYIDYGNRETVNITNVAALPARFAADKPYAHEYVLACVRLTEDADEKKAAVEAFKKEVMDKILLLNVEYHVNHSLYAATLINKTTSEDIGKKLISEGFVLVERQRLKCLAKLMEEYKNAEDEAEKAHRNIFIYGDIRAEDDDEQFRS